MSSTPTLTRGLFAPRDGVTPRIYLDLKTSVITRAEMEAITAIPARVIVHEFGAWVNVPAAEHIVWGDSDWDEFPNVRQVLLYARSRGAHWVNLDRDGWDTIAGLPTFAW